METKTASASVEFKASGLFEVVFATTKDAEGKLVIDRDGDVYAAGAVGEQAVTIGCWNHSQCGGSAGVGKTFETPRDIRAQGRLFIEEEHGRAEWDVWRALGDRAQFSYTFTIVDHDFIEIDGRRVRRLKSLAVYSIDLVQNPAGMGTHVASLKSAEACSCGCGGSGACGGLSKAQKADLLAIKEGHALRQREAMQRAQVALLGLQVKQAKQTLTAIAPTVAKAQVSARLVQMAEKTAAIAARELGIVAPEVKWFAPGGANDRGARGHTFRDGVIWLSSKLSTPVELINVAAHEVKHLTQADGMLRAQEEADAEAFAGWFVIERYSEAAGL